MTKKSRILYSCLAFFLLQFSNCIATLEPAILFSFNTQHLLSKSNGTLISSTRVLKKGESCGYAISFLHYNTAYRGPKNSLAEIANDFGIERNAVVDYASFSFLGLIFYKNCLFVWGNRITAENLRAN
ncbi:TRL domain-containing protein [Leptospira stimsonii]|uniref:TRL-like family protein n=1 Tax=Leptospira stimsonii TaxID=2202203 RepID=A0ABY2NDK4_9LEPT|nr:hypothetical protein EHO98_17795 [Leptospira stimsonii]TGM22109.1 hypothetical protein EHQ90_01265 [Leptospira stimsonii]